MTCGRTFIEIQEEKETPDGSGGRETEWVKFSSAFADPRWVKGNEQTKSSDGDRVAAVETWLLKINFISGITTDMRVLWDGRNYNIRSAADREQKRRHIILEIEAGVAD